MVVQYINDEWRTLQYPQRDGKAVCPSCCQVIAEIFEPVDCLNYVWCATCLEYTHSACLTVKTIRKQDNTYGKARLCHGCSEDMTG